MKKLIEALEKIADTDYCETSKCADDKTASECRECLAGVAMNVLKEVTK